MGIAERKEREKEQRRNDITDAAERIFFSKGFEHATMEDIAEEAELGKGTLYSYFNSKEEVYLSIVNRAQRLLCRKFEEAMAAQVTGLAKVRAIGEVFIHFFAEETDYAIALNFFIANKVPFVPENRVIRECHEQMMCCFNLVTEALQQGIRDGSIRGNIDPLKTALILNVASQGLIQFMSRTEEIIQPFFNIQPQDLISYFFEYMENSLKCETISQSKENK